MLAKLRGHERLRLTRTIGANDVRMIFVSLPVAGPAEGEGVLRGARLPDQRALLGRAHGVRRRRRDHRGHAADPRLVRRLTGAEAGDPARPTAIPCLTVEDRGEVDDLVAKAARRGRPFGQPAADEDSRYTGSFTDPDGNVWQVLWLDQLHVVN